MAYQSPLGSGFKLEASIGVVKKLRDEERNKSEENKNKSAGGSKKRKQEGPAHPIRYPKPTKVGKTALSYFLMNPTTPEPLLNDKRIRPIRLNGMLELEGASETVLRNVIREALCTCFNFFSPYNLNQEIVDIVRTAIARAWAAVDVMTYDSVVEEVGGLTGPGKKKKRKKNGVQIIAAPKPNSCIEVLVGNEKSVQTDITFTDVNTTTGDVTNSSTSNVLHSMNSDRDGVPFWSDEYPIVFMEEF